MIFNLNFTIKTSHPYGNSKQKRRNMVLFNPLSAYVLTNPSCGKGILVLCFYKLNKSNILNARGLQIITKTLTMLKFLADAWVTVQIKS